MAPRSVSQGLSALLRDRVSDGDPVSQHLCFSILPLGFRHKMQESHHKDTKITKNSIFVDFVPLCHCGEGLVPTCPG